MDTWFCDVSHRIDGTFDDERLDDALEAINDHGGILSVSDESERICAHYAFSANSALAAIEIASQIAKATEAACGHVEGIDIRDERCADRELYEPDIPTLVGYAEIAAMAGVSRQRARQFAEIQGFPNVATATAGGPLFVKAAVDEWLNSRNSKPRGSAANR